MNFEKMNSEQLVSHVNGNMEAFKHIEDSKKEFIRERLNEGASYQQAVVDMENGPFPNLDHLRSENEVIANILWERAKNEGY